MKRSILATAVATLMVLQPAVAQVARPPSEAAQVQPPALNPADFDKQLSQAQEYMQLMQTHMDKIRQARDPQERQKYLQEHWATMQSAMAVMHGMWGPGGAGCCANGPGMMGPGMMGGPMMGWGHMKGYYSGLTPEQIRQRQYMMDRYLPMQQLMLEHMMWQQRWQYQPPPAAK